MAHIDYLIIVLYLVAVTGAGLWFRRRAAASLESYFLGGKSLHWSLLAASGAVSNFDIAGTAWMVSVLYVLGMQSWWHHWMWGVALPAFGLAFMARWVRRSKVLTAAEWMVTRFGSGRGGRAARYAYALMAVITQAAFIGYAFQGIGKFAAIYLPLDQLAGFLPVSAAWLAEHQAAILATVILGITTLYVVLGGLYSVVVTDLIQTVILTCGALAIMAIAYSTLSAEVIAERVPAAFVRVVPDWRLDHLAGTDHAAYEMFGLLTLAWIVKGLLMNAGGPAQMYDFQRYLAAASVRDACKLAAAWPFFLVVRWGMVAAITLLALCGVVSVSDPETIMPAVLQEILPIGVRGLVIAGLLAAFMSTFSSTVNSGAAFIVRDLWQPIFRPDAGEAQLVRSSYIATVGIVVAGVVIGTQAESIGTIWSWIMMALGAGVIVPNVLRWYWERLNGWGYAAGIAGGMLLAVIVLVFPGLPVYVTFPLICAGSFAGCIVVALVTAPTDTATLSRFHASVRPFGAWRVAGRQQSGPKSGGSATESPRRAVLNTAVAVIGLTCLYLGPMYLVGHWHLRAGLCLAGVVATVVVLYATWYRHLPAAEQEKGRDPSPLDPEL